MNFEDARCSPAQLVGGPFALENASRIVRKITIYVGHAGPGSRSELGQSLPGRASSKSGHVRYASKAEESPLLVIFLCGLMGDAHDVISSQQPVERWHGAASGNLARTLSHRCARWAAASWHPPVRSPRSTLDCAHCRQAECSKVSCDQTVSPC